MNEGRAAACLGALACLAPIWSSGHLPTVDLPQHAAQIALWVHRADPDFFPPGTYRFNWFTPYLGAYLVARIFAALVSVPVALKLTVSVAAVAVPFSALALLRATRGEPWWALAAAPLAFGVCFYSGFLNFMLAIPVTVCLIAATIGFGESPSLRSGTKVGLASLALAACHALAFGVGLLVAIAALWGASAERRTRLRGSLWILAPFPVVAAWAVSVWLREPHVRTAVHWAGFPSRLFRMPAALLGSPEAATGVAVLAVLALAFGLLGVRFRREPALVAALGAAAAFYVASPDAAFHTVVLPERFPALLAVPALALLRMPSSGPRRGAAIAIVIALTLGFSLHLASRFRAFDREMAGFDEVLERTEPGKVLRMIPVDAWSRAVPGYPLFWNVGAWYQVEKGGHLGFSFSQLFPVLVRYRSTPAWAEPMWGKRGELRWTDADREVDYFLFRSESVDPASSFPEEPERPRLLARSGAWLLYGKRPPGGS